MRTRLTGRNRRDASCGTEPTAGGRRLWGHRRRLRIERLENRRLLSVFTVENLDDSGDGSLRAAIEAANANPGADTIEFAVAGTIYVESELPSLNDPTGGLLIDGTTAPGYVPDGDPVVILDGSLATSDTTGVTVESDSNEIRGLKIQSFDDSGIRNFGTLMLGNSAIVENSALDGGGIYSRAGTLAVSGSTITGNSATEDDGGGIHCDAGTLTVADSTVARNSAADNGGGIYLLHSTATVANSTVAGNSAAGIGGGFRTFWSPLAISNSTVVGNSADFGGGIFNQRSVLTLANSSVSANSASSAGGGIYDNSGTMLVTNSSIVGNTTNFRGGGISSNDSTVMMTNSTVAGNLVYNRGGGISNNSGTVTLVNSIVAQNVTYYSAPDISGPLTAGSDYNLIGIWSDDSTLPGQHNLSGTSQTPLDPQLSELTDLGDGVWGYLLLPDSPAINTGSNALAVDPDGVPLESDLYGNPRIQDGVVDIGAVEGATEPGAAVSYIVESLDDQVIEDGVISFREAFLAATSNRSVGDAPAGSFGQQDRIGFSSGLSGTVLLGGQALTIHGDLAIEGPGADALTLDAQDASGVLEILPLARVGISGMTITGGSAIEGGGIHNLGTLTLIDSTVEGNSAVRRGGGIRSLGTLALIRSTIARNSAESGGGICVDQGTLTVTSTAIVENSAGEGGGIFIDEGTLTLTNSTVAENSADSGGGIYSLGSSTVAGSTIADNLAVNVGGGVYSNETLAVTNSTVAGNSATNGGGIFGHAGTLTVTNSTVARNSASERGGGLYSEEAEATLTNSTIAGNSADISGGVLSIADTLTVTNSTIVGNRAHTAGGGCTSGANTVVMLANSIVAQNVTSEYPDFYGRLAGESDYNLIGIWSDGSAPPPNTLVGTPESPLDPRLGPLADNGGPTWTHALLADSPAIDVGDPHFDPYQFDPPLLTDQRGRFRVADDDGSARVDIGAYEFGAGVPAEILDRHVFYNHSSFDGNDAEVNEADDAAIATDKRALLLGQTATFANYTSYTRGINGVMVDIAGLAGMPTAADFEFRVGNNDDPDQWAMVADVPTIDVRHGAGLGGSDRVTIVWTDHAIQKTWLQVTVLPGGNIGLTQPDVFYYGNAIGETGNSATDAKVNAIDMLGARDNQRNFFDPAPIDFNFDFDRNARVNATDMLIARNNTTHFLNALKLITVPGGKSRGSRVESREPRVEGGELGVWRSGLLTLDSGLSTGNFDWLHEFEQTNTNRRSPQKRGMLPMAIDDKMGT